MKRIITISLLIVSVAGFAQEKLSVIQQAMRDELERNMKELKSEGFEKPFFINYTLGEETQYQMEATLGALQTSTENKVRQALSIRLLVGDYDFNDESLDNNLYSPPRANEINLPLDDDYLGIRRSLWISTDNVYRSASRQFAKNKELLKEANKPLAEVPHRTFAKVAPSKIDRELPEIKFVKSAVEDYIRKVSAVFIDYKDLYFTDVNFYYRRGYRYLVNSEGSINKVPTSIAAIQIDASIKTPEGEFIIDQVKHFYITPELPPVEKMIAEAKQLAEKVISRQKAPVFKEEYSGPVLFEDEHLAQLFIKELFSGSDDLMANNAIPSLKGFRFDQPNTAESKIGKPVYFEGMTVKATPKMTKFQGQTLFGSFEVDDEGVVPADETVIIENGVLKTLLNDRTLTKAGQTANGLGNGAGVLSVDFRNTIPESAMKAKLIERAKKEGLEYGIIVRDNDTMFAGVIDIYKVYVDDGREELVRNASSKEFSQRDFRKILEASGETSVHNLNRAGRLISVICPKALLFEEMEFNASNMPNLKEEEYVSSPLKN